MNDRNRKSPKRAATDMNTILRAVLGEERFPVDVEALAMEVSRNYPDPITAVKGVDIDGFEGMLRARRKKPGWQILYNNEERYRGRQRFTLAHEFGHYLLHRKPLTLADYRDGELPDGFDFECVPMQSNQWKDAEKEREEEADTFASYLLMPIDDYRKQVTGTEMSWALLGHVTSRYGVSLTAAARKWIEFTDRRAAMVVARDGYVLWGRASSAAFKSGIFIPSGMPIPDGSVVAQGPGGQQSQSDQAIGVPAGVWHFSRGTEAVRELSVFSERLGLSITLLHFENEDPGREYDDDEPWDTYDQFVGRRQ